MIPKGWAETTLAEVASFENGKAHENCIDESGKYIVVNSKFISSEGKVCKRTNNCLSPLCVNDLTMVMSDIPNGKALAKCFIVKENEKYTLNQRICSLRITHADSKYLYYALNRHRYFLQFDNGVGQTNLRKDEVLECPVLLPPLSEQRKIVEILSCWDHGIEKLEQVLSRKEDWKTEVMRRLFKETVGEQESPWLKVRLSEVCTCYSGGTPSRLHPEFFDGQIPWIKSGELNLGEIYQTGEKISELALENSSAKVVEPDTVLLAMYGATAGVVATTKIRAAINQAILAIVPNEQRLNRRYLYHFLRFSTKDLLRRVQGGQPNLSGELVKGLNLLLPSLDAQKEIGNLLDTIEESQSLSLRLLDVLKKQKQALMQSLLTGKIRVKA